ncbi:S8 family serine peptidase [Sphingomonas jatrophae]|nr:S8 family serine peptidase [Sphingomonas jatrophae]
MAAALLIGTCLGAPAFAGKVKSTTAGTVAGGTEISPLYRNINPFYRNIGAFWGDVNPFYRNIGAFWGDVDPFYRNIQAFWGDINPLYRNIGAFGQIVPEYRNIGAFWEQTGTLWTGIDSSWSALGAYQTDKSGYVALATQLTTLRTQSEAFFGAAVLSQTGKTFGAGFADPMFAKYGISLSDPASLETLSPERRSQFFMDWYDGLMNFSGTDHVDHWMKTANWKPIITQQQGSGADTTIGLIDFHVAGDKDLQSKTIYNGGVSTFSNGHGAAVGSLIASAHDGKGVMGIAPNVKIAAFNPFDASGTADWPDIKRGIAAVAGKGASVINLSLGVPGYTLEADWRGVFMDPAVKSFKDKAIYVIAAGNDGVTQTQNVNMKDTFDNTFIIVGSVDPTGKISEFSNRPGSVCLLDDTVCKDDPNKKIQDQLKESGLLMRRFIVAPGELILVSDDKGGVTRMSGTSFAAPLVSGAIALIHDRWPWLKQQPRAVAAAILGSAKDLGAPGIDPVYGVGMLDVEASQSPLNFETLKYYVVDGTKQTEVKVGTLETTGIQSTWETKNLYFSAFEELPGAKRDFLIPLSSRLVGTMQGGQYFQSYVYDRMVSWLGGGTSGYRGFSDVGGTGVNVTGSGLRMGMTMRVAHPFANRFGAGRAKLYSSMTVEAPEGGASFTFGRGDGAAFVGGQSGFGMRADYDAQVGGVNPVLGFASGGAHASAKVRAAEGLDIAVGMTRSDAPSTIDQEMMVTGRNRAQLARLGNYRANAANVRLDYKIDDAILLTASLTRLNEARSLLGVRSLEPSDIAGGTITESATVGADARLTDTLSLTASFTAARSRTSGDAALRIGSGGLLGTAYQVGLTKHRLFGKTDRLRLSVAQPLRVERGTIDFKTVAVTDRQTGEIGIVTQSLGVAGTPRRFVGEMLYGATMFDGAVDLSAFGRGELTGYESGIEGLPKYIVGGRFSLGL